MKHIWIFLIFFLSPMVYWRSLFYLYVKSFDTSFARTKTGLQIHHLHYGVVLIFIASQLLLFTGNSIYVIILLGLGLGLVLDEFIPSLYMPGDRPLELRVYRQALGKTLILFLALALGIIIFSLFI